MGDFGSAAQANATSRKLAHILRTAIDFIFLANAKDLPRLRLARSVRKHGT
jgi:hypothetical protein